MYTLGSTTYLYFFKAIANFCEFWEFFEISTLTSSEVTKSKPISLKFTQGIHVAKVHLSM